MMVVAIWILVHKVDLLNETVKRQYKLDMSEIDGRSSLSCGLTVFSVGLIAVVDSNDVGHDRAETQISLCPLHVVASRIHTSIPPGIFQALWLEYEHSSVMGQLPILEWLG